MYVVHFKRRSAILTLAGVVLAAVLALVLAGCFGGKQAESVTLADDAARVEYLTQLGWQTDSQPMETLDLQLPENLEPETLRGLGTGNVAGFDTDWPCGADIRFSGSVCLDADGYNSWYVADISAYVSYAGGVFTLSDLHLNSN